MRILSVALLFFPSFGALAEELIPLNRVFFVTSPRWYILDKLALDNDVLVFRKYSFSVIDGELAGIEKTKNILDFGCQRSGRYDDYVVFHLPVWVNTGLNKSEWRPRQRVHIGINDLSITFDAEAEFKNVEIFLDLNVRSKQNLLKMIAAQSIVLDYGLSDSQVRIKQLRRLPNGDGEVVQFVDDFVIKLIAPNVGAKKVKGFGMDEMLAACLAYKRTGKF